tara:strand:+ start:204 stop:758 length:555 start_codon:yes stop_codon:yes gene_type:complete
MSGILNYMSRVAKNPIQIPEKVEINISSNQFVSKGSNGEIKLEVPSGFKIVKNENTLIVETLEESLKESPLWGTLRSLIANAIKGVNEGFSKILELNGTGYRASVNGKTLKLQLGYSHDINYLIPEGIKIECPKQNIIKLFSHDKELLGKIAAEIRSYRKPEPFKGKGIKYQNEYIFRKEGKKK